MPTSSKEIIFPFVFVGFVASVAYSIFLYFKIIREINEAEGQPDRGFNVALWSRGLHLVYRHRQACPEGGSTRAGYIFLSILNGVLFLSLCMLWYG